MLATCAGTFLWAEREKSCDELFGLKLVLGHVERDGTIAGAIWGCDVECAFRVLSETWCVKIHAARFLF